MRGLVMHPQNSSIRYARSDTWGAYRWDAPHAHWVHMVTASSIPPSALVASSKDPTQTFKLTATPNSNGVDSIAIDPQLIMASRLVIFLSMLNWWQYQDVPVIFGLRRVQEHLLPAAICLASQTVTRTMVCAATIRSDRFCRASAVCRKFDCGRLQNCVVNRCE